MERVVRRVADVPERDGTADPGDDDLGIGDVFGAEGDTAEGLHADEFDVGGVLPQIAGEGAGGGARADAADQGQAAPAPVPARRPSDPLRHRPVAQVVDVVVVLPHPVVLRVLREDLVDARDPPLLVQLQVVAGLHPLQRRPEHGQLGAQRAVDGRRPDDVTAHAVAVAGQREGVRVDPAGAVQQGVPAPHRPRVEQMADRGEGGDDLHGLKAQADEPVVEAYQVGPADGLRDVLVHSGTPWSGGKGRS